MQTADQTPQSTDYYPYGLEIPVYGDHDNQLKYNSKELQNEADLTWYDYGARFYDPVIGRWHVVDPMAEKSRRWSPYTYCLNNPIRFIDPDGMMVDDYFNKHGKYLGSDEAKTDNIKVISQEDWDNNKTVNNDGTESIDHSLGNEKSSDHSSSGISTEASLAIYDHYNPTDLPLKEHGETSNWGMTFHAEGKIGKTSEWIKIKIEGNNREKISGHYNEIINLFSHEESHYNDYKELGIEAFNEMYTKSLDRIEQRAVTSQMEHPSWKDTRKGFQDAMRNYGTKFGMVSPMKPKTIRSIQ